MKEMFKGFHYTYKSLVVIHDGGILKHDIITFNHKDDESILFNRIDGVDVEWCKDEIVRFINCSETFKMSISSTYPMHKKLIAAMYLNDGTFIEFFDRVEAKDYGNVQGIGSEDLINVKESEEYPGFAVITVDDETDQANPTITVDGAERLIHILQEFVNDHKVIEETESK